MWQASMGKGVQQIGKRSSQAVNTPSHHEVEVALSHGLKRQEAGQAFDGRMDERQ
jgi:hypothetical protein